MEIKWLLCPICGGKTRTKLRPDTEAKNLIVFCPKCKRESVVDIERETQQFCKCYMYNEFTASSNDTEKKMVKRTEDGRYYLHCINKDFQKNKIIQINSCPICGKVFE